MGKGTAWGWGRGRAGGDQDHHCPEGDCSGTLSEAPGMRAGARDKEHRASMGMSFLNRAVYRA